MMVAMMWCAYRMMGYCYGALMEVVAEDLEQSGLAEVEGLISGSNTADRPAGRFAAGFPGAGQLRWIVDKWHDLLSGGAQLSPAGRTERFRRPSGARSGWNCLPTC